MDVLTVSLFLALFLVVPEVATSEEKTTIGAVEDVILLPWGVRLPARIDTGAAKTSLDARELTIIGDMAEFRLPEKYGGKKLRLPIVEWKHILSPDRREKRPVVQMEFCIGSRRVHGKVNLADRSVVRYPLILGRNFLRGRFVVDVKQSHLLPPNCSSSP